MITKGLGISAKGLISLIDRQDVIANNLANVNTVGFKKSNLVFQNVYNAALREKTPPNEFKFSDERYIGELAMGPKTQKILLDFEQGNMEHTGNPFDVAIQGDGFFKVQSIDGNVAYTRNGSFTVNNEKFLVTKENEYVLDVNNKPIQLDMKKLNLSSANDLIIMQDGTIQTNSIDNQNIYQQIGVFDFKIKSEMRSVGDSKFVPKDITTNPEVPAEKFVIEQGTLEGSNSNTVHEMINMINVSRNYETLSKFVKNDGDLLSRAINLGRIS